MDIYLDSLVGLEVSEIFISWFYETTRYALLLLQKTHQIICIGISFKKNNNQNVDKIPND
jgi:hypothetical protein